MAAAGAAAATKVDPKTNAAPDFTVQVLPKLGGSYFRKISSAPDPQARGIAAVGTLPTVTFDPKRFFTSPRGLDHFTTGPLDHPSVYLGGNAGGKEIDAGLTWDRVYDKHKRPAYTDRPNDCDGDDPRHRFFRDTQHGHPVLLDGNGKVVARGADVEKRMASLHPDFAFRPFWRTTNDGGNQWNNPAVGSALNQYFYPGQKIAMTFKDVGKDKVRLDIQLEGTVTPRHFSHDFRQEQFGVGNPESFKRVNAIDQFTVVAGERKGVMGDQVLPTSTQAVGAQWTSVGILVGSRPQPMVGSAFTDTRATDLAPAYDKIFHISDANPKGGERLDIIPGAAAPP